MMDELAGLKDYPLARRGVIMTSLISGLTLATTRVEAQAITTPSDGLVAGLLGLVDRSNINSWQEVSGVRPR